MKTSAQWWSDTKSSESKINDWLIKQWRGEVTASVRIRKLAEQYVDSSSREAKILNQIAEQEDMHASWIKILLDARRIEADRSEILQAENRYWEKTLPGIKDFSTGTAVAAHAEGMRLERIRVIAGDAESPDDIRDTFAKILRDEEWHESAFLQLSTAEALEATQGDYELGRQALGLEA